MSRKPLIGMIVNELLLGKCFNTIKLIKHFTLKKIISELRYHHNFVLILHKFWLNYLCYCIETNCLLFKIISFFSVFMINLTSSENKIYSFKLNFRSRPQKYDMIVGLNVWFYYQNDSIKLCWKTWITIKKSYTIRLRSLHYIF